MRLSGSRGRYERCDGWRACLSAMAARLKRWADACWREERYDYPDAPLVGAPWVLWLLSLEWALAALRDLGAVQTHLEATPQRWDRFQLRMQRILEVVLARDGCSVAALRPALKMLESVLAALVGALADMGQSAAIPWLIGLRNKPRGVPPALNERAVRQAQGDGPPPLEGAALVEAADQTAHAVSRIAAARALTASDRFRNGGATRLLALAGDVVSHELAALEMASAEPRASGNYEVFAWLAWAKRFPVEALPGGYFEQGHHDWDEAFRRCGEPRAGNPRCGAGAGGPDDIATLRPG